MFTTALADARSATATEGEDRYASDLCFRHIFIQNMSHLYLLAFLLTADGRLAEKCFIGSFEDCLADQTVFKNFAERWSRRRVTINAIRLVSARETPRDGNPEGDQAEPQERLDLNQPLEAITQLKTLERAILVLSVLERHTHQECSILLNCARCDVVRARTRALEKLAVAGTSVAREEARAQ